MNAVPQVPLNARIAAEPAEYPEYARRYVNVASSRLGARVIAVSDEFFGAAERMLSPTPAIFVPDKYDEAGKWMDGWESRRKRHEGHDWAIIELARPVRIHGVDVDTSHFSGNHPHAVAVSGCYKSDQAPTIQSNWQPIVTARPTDANSHHFWATHYPEPVSHILLRIFPDGGVARLRVYGEFIDPWYADDMLDLVSVLNGGRVLAVSDAHFGNSGNLLMPDRGRNMGDGWETRRRRQPGHEWCILALGLPGYVNQIELDTAHFKGNYPDRVSIQAASLNQPAEAALVAQSLYWRTLLPETPVGPDQIHRFEPEAFAEPITHIRVNAIPDGGISRIRLWGHLANG